MSELDRMGRSALHYAAADANEALAQELVNSGYDVNLADVEGFTPLHAAAQSQSVEVTRLLLDNGANIDPTNRFGNTPLFVAIMSSSGATEEIELLRDRGADPTIKNHSGVSPLDLAQTIDNFDFSHLFPDAASS